MPFLHIARKYGFVETLEPCSIFTSESDEAKASTGDSRLQYQSSKSSAILPDLHHTSEESGLHVAFSAHKEKDLREVAKLLGDEARRGGQPVAQHEALPLVHLITPDSHQIINFLLDSDSDSPPERPRRGQADHSSPERSRRGQADHSFQNGHDGDKQTMLPKRPRRGLNDSLKIAKRFTVQGSVDIPPGSELLCEGHLSSVEFDEAKQKPSIKSAKEELRKLKTSLEHSQKSSSRSTSSLNLKDKLGPVKLFFRPPRPREFTVEEFFAEEVSCLAFSADGTRLAVADKSGKIQLWSLSGTQLQRRSIELQGVDEGLIESLSFGPDGRSLAAGGEAAKVKVWWEVQQARTDGKGQMVPMHWEPLLELPVSGKITAVSFSFSIRYLAVAMRLVEENQGLMRSSWDLPVGEVYGRVEVWDLDTCQLDRESLEPEEFKDVVIAFAYAPNKLWLAVGGVRIGAKSGEYGVTLLPGDKQFASTSTSVLLDEKRFLNHESAIKCLAWNPGSELLAVGGENGKVTVYNITTTMPERVLLGHSMSVKSVGFSPDGRSVAAGGNSHMLTIWNLESCGLERELVFATGMTIHAVAFAPGAPLLAVGMKEKRFGLLELDHSGKSRHVSTGQASTGKGMLAQIRNSASNVSSVTLNTQWAKFEVEAQHATKASLVSSLASTKAEIPGGNREVTCMSVGPGGTRIAVGFKMHSNTTSDASGDTVSNATTPSGKTPVQPSSPSPRTQGKQSKDLCVAVYELQGESFTVRQSIVGGEPRAVALFARAEDGEDVKAHVSRPGGKAFKGPDFHALHSSTRGTGARKTGPPCKVMVVAIQTDRLHAWNLDGPEMSPFKGIPDSKGADVSRGQANSLALTSDGHCIAVGDSMGFVTLFDPNKLNEKQDQVPSGQEIEAPYERQLTVLGGMKVKALAFSPDNNYLAASGDLTIMVWLFKGYDKNGQPIWEFFASIDTKGSTTFCLAFSPFKEPRESTFEGKSVKGEAITLAVQFPQKVRVFDLGPTKDKVFEIEHFELPHSENDQTDHDVRCLRFSHSGRTLVGTVRGHVGIWTLDRDHQLKLKNAAAQAENAEKYGLNLLGQAFDLVFDKEIRAEFPHYIATVHQFTTRNSTLSRMVFYDIEQYDLAFHLPDLKSLSALSLRKTMRAMPGLLHQRLLSMELGWSLLHWAAFDGSVDLVRQLINLGASPFALDIAQRNVIDLALLGQHYDIVDKILRDVIDNPALLKDTLPEHHEALTRTVVELLSVSSLSGSLAEFLDRACMQVPRALQDCEVPQRAVVPDQSVLVTTCIAPIFSPNVARVITPPGDSERLVEVYALFLKGPLDLKFGLIKALCKTPNLQVLQTRFVRAILHYKWEMHAKRVFLLQLHIYLVYLGFFVLWLQFYYRRGEGEDSHVGSDLFWAGLGYSMYFMTLYFAAHEMRQVFQEAKNTVSAEGVTGLRKFTYCAWRGTLTYLTDVWNCMDLVRIGFAYGVLSQGRKTPANVASLAALFLWLRLLFFCRGFSGTGALVRMVVLIMYDMRYFLVLMVIIWVAFSHAFFILHKESSPYEFEDEDYEDTPWDALMWTWRLTFLGESEIGDGHPRLISTLWVVCTFGSTIVMLNLLIAIMGDTYTKVQENTMIARNQERAKLVYELETIMPPRQPPQLYLLAAFAHDGGDSSTSEVREDDAGGRLAAKVATKRKEQKLFQRMAESLNSLHTFEEKFGQTQKQLGELDKAMRNQENQLADIQKNLKQLTQSGAAGGPAPSSSPEEHRSTTSPRDPRQPLVRHPVQSRYDARNDGEFRLAQGDSEEIT